MSIETIHLAELQTICKEYWNKIARLEGDKYDLEIIEQFKNFEVTSDTRTNFYNYKHYFLVCLNLRISNSSKSNLISLKRFDF